MHRLDPAGGGAVRDGARHWMERCGKNRGLCHGAAHRRRYPGADAAAARRGSLHRGQGVDVLVHPRRREAHPVHLADDGAGFSSNRSYMTTNVTEVVIDDEGKNIE